MSSAVLAFALGSCVDDTARLPDAATESSAAGQASASLSGGVTALRTCADLQGIDRNLNRKYRLANDIDCTSFTSAGAGFDPIGDDTARAFRGELDGAGHVIRGLRIARPSTNGVGLLASTDHARVHELGLVDVDIQGKGRVGALVGHDYESSFDEVFATGRVVGLAADVGGLVGEIVETELEDSYSRVDVRGPN